MKNDERDLEVKLRYYYESDMARFERINKRQWILCILLCISSILNVLLWITK